MPAGRSVERLIVLDFETTGLSVDRGARVIEVGAVEIVDGRIARTWQSLANPGTPVPSEITQLTGITSAMVRRAPPVADVMREFAQFLGSDQLVAHNASFDGPFLAAEMTAVGYRVTAELLCTLKLARRVYRNIPSYRLGALVSHLQLDAQAGVHRALADATAAARLLLRIQQDLLQRYELPDVSVQLLRALQAKQPRQAEGWLRRSIAIGEVHF